MRTSGGRFVLRSSTRSFCFKSIRAAALDDGEPTGKSPGRGAESVAGRNGVLLELRIVFDLLIVLRCCDYSLRKLNRELAIASVHFEFFLRHALEQFV
jgi:hypothetical protein